MFKKFSNVIANLKSKAESPRYKVDAWLDSDSVKVWIAVFRDENGKQVGYSGMGSTKSKAVTDLHYQNHESNI
jgi:hypothetical protein